MRLRVPVVDPDSIARELAPDAPEHAATQAGREALRRRAAYMAAGQSFILETTLAGRTVLRSLEEARQRGFRIHLIFIGVETPATLVGRIAGRVAQGGHNVPVEDIRRRYVRGMDNLPHAIRLADHATIFDNSRRGEPQRILRSSHPLPGWVNRYLLIPLSGQQQGRGG